MVLVSETLLVACKPNAGPVGAEQAAVSGIMSRSDERESSSDWLRSSHFLLLPPT